MKTTNETFTLITGGTSGIGYELAKIFAAKGHNLVLVARDTQRLEEVKSELSATGISVITVSKDLFNIESASELFDEVMAMGIEVDILVNNAGQGHYGLFKDGDLYRDLDIIRLNTESMVVLTKKFLAPMLMRQRGRILNLSSIAGTAPGPYQAVYHATKAFVQSFTEALREEVKEEGIVVTALLPGATDTDFFRKADMLDSKIMETDLADAAKVAKDGYDALMHDDHQVISGFKNNVQVTMGRFLSDETKAGQMRKQQEPTDK